MTYSFKCCDDGSGIASGSILRFDNVTILLDPGWSSYKVSYEDSVAFWSNIIAEVDIILISQPTTECLGAYTFLYYNFISHFISHIQVYATLPVANLGRVSTIEFYVTKGIIGPYQTNQLDIDDVEKAFDFIDVLKYSQLVDLRPKYDGLSLFAYNSGYAPGGAIWCITTYSEKLIYAPRWNHTRDTILNAANLLDNTGKPLSSLMRPSAIVTNFDHFGSSQPFRKRAKSFKDILKTKLSNNGNILIPVDIGGKFLDLFVLVHDFLYENGRNNKLANIPIVLLSYTKARSLTYAKSMTEWFSSISAKTWENRNQKTAFDLDTPFSVVDSNELANLKGPKICFVSNVETLVNDALSILGSDNNTLLVLTTDNRQEVPALHTIYDYWKENNTESSIESANVLKLNQKITINTTTFKELQNEELDAYLSKLEQRKRKQLITEITTRKGLKKGAAVALPTNLASDEGQKTEVDLVDDITNTEDLEKLLEEEEEDEDEDNEDNLINILEDEDRADGIEESIPVDIIITPGVNNKHKIFPFQPLRQKKDDYGIVVKFDQFVPAEDKDDITPSKRHINGDNEEDMDDDYVIKEASNKKIKSDSVNQPTKETKFSDDINHLRNSNRPGIREFKATEVNLNMSLTFINMESLVDRRSCGVIWPLFKSRKLILMGPSNVQDKHVTGIITSKTMEVTSLAYNQSIDFDTTIKALDITISPELDALLKWQRISNDYTLAHVTGRLVKESAHQSSAVPVTDNTTSSGREKYVLKPLNGNVGVQTNGSLAIGDVRLIKLKQNLNATNHTAEFKGEGILVVDDKVIIRKISDSETIIDGPPSALFYSVKKLVMDMLAKI